MPSNFKEEITDILTSDGIRSGTYKKGQVLKFANGIALKLTKVDKKNGRAWAEHIRLVKEDVVSSHGGHDVSGGGPGDLPFCKDCGVNIDEPSTEDGEKKYLDRRDAEDEQLQTA